MQCRFEVVPSYLTHVLVVILLVATFVCAAAEQTTGSSLPPVSGVFMKVRLEPSVRLAGLKPGDVVAGTLVRPVFSGERELFPAGTTVHLTVDKLERQRRTLNDRWPWVVRMFLPHRQNYPTFQSSRVTLADGSEVALNTSLISIGERRETSAETKKASQSRPDKNRLGNMLTLEATVPEALKTGDSPAVALPGPVTLEAGTQARIILLGDVSASGSRSGDSIQARLTEPVRVGSRIVLPEGSVFRGEVVKSTKPRWLSRSGSLLLKFTNLTLPEGATTALMASVAGVESDKNSRLRVDAEGQLRGERPGKAWMAANLGVSTAIAKAADDGAQLLIEAVISTATDVSTAGVSRIVALGASGVFLLTRHGSDVVLPKFTELQITLDRPMFLPGRNLQSDVVMSGTSF